MIGTAIEHLDRRIERFETFNREGGKFRVAIVNVCNLDCFFCHNEGMPNPRLLPLAQKPIDRLDDQALLAIINTFAAMGGRQINITGGEPLAHPDIVGFLSAIDAGNTRIMLNTNALLARRLTKAPVLPVIHTILASLHTLDDEMFRKRLGGRRAADVPEQIVNLRNHGYRVEINYSLGDYNKQEFLRVLEFALKERIQLKAIAFVRPNERQDFYNGPWVDPRWLEAVMEKHGAIDHGRSSGFGGTTTRYEIDGVTVKIKNIARGKLRTDFCADCAHSDICGEGIYALRSGVDAVWKPCLLRTDRFSAIKPGSIRKQILDQIDAMVGEWSNASQLTGAPA